MEISNISNQGPQTYTQNSISKPKVQLPTHSTIFQGQETKKSSYCCSFIKKLSDWICQFIEWITGCCSKSTEDTSKPEPTSKESPATEPVKPIDPFEIQASEDAILIRLKGPTNLLDERSADIHLKKVSQTIKGEKVTFWSLESFHCKQSEVKQMVNEVVKQINDSDIIYLQLAIKIRTTCTPYFIENGFEEVNKSRNVKFLRYKGLT